LSKDAHRKLCTKPQAAQEDRVAPLTIAYTPDSDDAFYYFALESGRVTLPGYELAFARAPMSVLNRAVGRRVFQVTAISSVVYPLIADQYAILSVGTSVGRGYGPVLVGRQARSLDELSGRRVGVPGIPTTGWFLLRRFCPEAVPVEMAFDRIGDAVAGGTLDAGVMIHEELLYWPRLGLHRIADLGARWCQRHNLPLPVGLNVIRRDLGERVMQEIAVAIRRSLQYGLSHRHEALAWVSRFGRGAEGQCTEPFVEMFANQDSLRMPADVRTALRVLCRELIEEALADAMPPLDIVEGRLSVTTSPVQDAA
jgi:1,4-dihydroxy-6-naphthoate synthase